MTTPRQKQRVSEQHFSILPRVPFKAACARGAFLSCLEKRDSKHHEEIATINMKNHLCAALGV